MIKHVLFTDGGCSGNPGIGAWAFNIYDINNNVYGESDGLQKTTNNVMELTAVIKGLECFKNNYLENNNGVAIFTDSEYVQKGITDWIITWKKNNWLKSDGESVKNKELWQKLDKLNSEINVFWYHVKGHSGVMGNERCDSMVQDKIKELSLSGIHYEESFLF